MYVTTPCYIQTFEHCGQAKVSEMGMCETNNACSNTTTVDGATRQEHILCVRDELITEDCTWSRDREVNLVYPGHVRIVVSQTLPPTRTTAYTPTYPHS